MKLSEKKNLYHRFLNKELEGKELEQFFLLLEQGEYDQDYLELMPDPELDSGQDVLPTPGYGRKPTVKLLMRLAIAASLLLVSVCSFLAYRRAEQLKLQSSYMLVSVPVGSLKVITLADHSVITLTSGAVFRYPAAFGPDNRKVFLESGKGFFQVAKDKHRPFTVYTDKISTTVLGTSFTVENYKAYHLEKVRLFSGKVEIGSRDRRFLPLQLSPGQQYSHNGRFSGKSIFANASEVPAYTEDGSLTFDHISMVEALIRVSSYYNVNIHFNRQELTDFAISGTFKNDPVEDVLQTLLFTHHLKFKKIPEGYTIMK